MMRFGGRVEPRHNFHKPGTQREHRVTVPMTEHEKEMVNRAAARLGISVSEYLRRMSLLHACFVLQTGKVPTMRASRWLGDGGIFCEVCGDAEFGPWGKHANLRMCERCIDNCKKGGCVHE